MEVLAEVVGSNPSTRSISSIDQETRVWFTLEVLEDPRGIVDSSSINVRFSGGMVYCIMSGQGNSL
jgi:hypothetical protein